MASESWSARLDWRQLEEFIEKFPERMFACMRDSLAKNLRLFETHHRQKRMRGRPGVKIRTRALHDSFNVVSMGNTVENLVVSYVSTSPYARLQEHGGTVRPRQAQFLAIPMPGTALTPSGKPRFFSPLRRSLAGRQTFVQTSKKGSKILFERRGEKLIPLFVLKRQTRVPGRLGVAEEWANYLPRFDEDTANDIQACLDRLAKDVNS